MIILLVVAQITIEAQLNKEYLNKELTVGDPFEITLVLEYPKGIEVSEPFVDSIEPFMILEEGKQSVEEGGLVTSMYNMKLVSFSTGELLLPPFRLLYVSDDTIDTLSSNNIPIKVVSVLPEDMEDINDIKKAIEFPNFLPLIIAGFILAGAIFAYVVYRYIKKLRSMRSSVKPLPTPWAEAVAALESIPVEDWLGKRLFKKYYYAISEILKRYLERRFEFKAAEQTTTEIATNLKVLRIPQREEFSAFFTRADMVKYAKYVPPRDEMNAAIHVAKDLIGKTRPEEKVGG